MTAFLLAAALQQEIDFRDLRPGDRVEVMFRSGYTLRGIVIPPPGRPADFDLSRSDKLYLDLQWEYDRIREGTLGVFRDTIRRIRRLKPLTKEQMQAILARKKIALEKLSEEERERMKMIEDRIRGMAERRAGPPEKEEKGPTSAMDLSEEEKEALDFYRRFPESEGWGEAKYEELKKVLIETENGYLDLRKGSRNAVTGQVTYVPADRREAEFFGGYAKWKAGRDVAKRLEEAKRAPPPQPPGSEKPPAPPEASPGDAYWNLRAAIAAGSVEEFLKWADSKTAERLKKAPDPEAVLKGLREAAPIPEKVVSSEVQGDQAELVLQGTDPASGVTLYGEVRMIREEGGWKVQVDSERWGEQPPGK